jgi:hypothetical protein
MTDFNHFMNFYRTAVKGGNMCTKVPAVGPVLSTAVDFRTAPPLTDVSLLPLYIRVCKKIIVNVPTDYYFIVIGGIQ